MKDTVITAKAKRREIIVASSCFLAACLINVYAIVDYHRPWTEIFSQIGYVIVIAGVFYALVWIVRLAVMFFSWLFSRRK